MSDTKLMAPVELSDYELDVVAAGGGRNGGDGGDNTAVTVGFINLLTFTAAGDGAQAGLINVD